MEQSDNEIPRLWSELNVAADVNAPSNPRHTSNELSSELAMVHTAMINLAKTGTCQLLEGESLSQENMMRYYKMYLQPFIKIVRIDKVILNHRQNNNSGSDEAPENDASSMDGLSAVRRCRTGMIDSAQTLTGLTQLSHRVHISCNQTITKGATLLKRNKRMFAKSRGANKSSRKGSRKTVKNDFSTVGWISCSNGKLKCSPSTDKPPNVNKADNAWEQFKQSEDLSDRSCTPYSGIRVLQQSNNGHTNGCQVNTLAEQISPPVRRGDDINSDLSSIVGSLNFDRSHKTETDSFVTQKESSRNNLESEFKATFEESDSFCEHDLKLDKLIQNLRSPLKKLPKPKKSKKAHKSATSKHSPRKIYQKKHSAKNPTIGSRNVVTTLNKNGGSNAIFPNEKSEDSMSESDLPDLKPIKRRNGNTLRNANGLGDVIISSSDSRRLTLDLPRHNWLEHKYQMQQRNAKLTSFMKGSSPVKCSQTYDTKQNAAFRTKRAGLSSKRIPKPDSLASFDNIHCNDPAFYSKTLRDTADASHSPHDNKTINGGPSPCHALYLRATQSSLEDHDTVASKLCRMDSTCQPNRLTDTCGGDISETISGVNMCSIKKKYSMPIIQSSPVLTANHPQTAHMPLSKSVRVGGNCHNSVDASRAYKSCNAFDVGDIEISDVFSLSAEAPEQINISSSDFDVYPQTTQQPEDTPFSNHVLIGKINVCSGHGAVICENQTNKKRKHEASRVTPSENPVSSAVLDGLNKSSIHSDVVPISVEQDRKVFKVSARRVVHNVAAENPTSSERYSDISRGSKPREITKNDSANEKSLVNSQKEQFMHQPAIDGSISGHDSSNDMSVVITRDANDGMAVASSIFECVNTAPKNYIAAEKVLNMSKSPLTATTLTSTTTAAGENTIIEDFQNPATVSSTVFTNSSINSKLVVFGKRDELADSAIADKSTVTTRIYREFPIDQDARVSTSDHVIEPYKNISQFGSKLHDRNISTVTMIETKGTRSSAVARLASIRNVYPSISSMGDLSNTIQQHLSRSKTGSNELQTLQRQVFGHERVLKMLIMLAKIKEKEKKMINYRINQVQSKMANMKTTLERVNEEKPQACIAEFIDTINLVANGKLDYDQVDVKTSPCPEKVDFASISPLERQSGVKPPHGSMSSIAHLAIPFEESLHSTISPSISPINIAQKRSHTDAAKVCARKPLRNSIDDQQGPCFSLTRGAGIKTNPYQAMQLQDPIPSTSQPVMIAARPIQEQSLSQHKVKQPFLNQNRQVNLPSNSSRVKYRSAFNSSCRTATKAAENQLSPSSPTMGPYSQTPPSAIDSLYTSEPCQFEGTTVNASERPIRMQASTYPYSSYQLVTGLFSSRLQAHPLPSQTNAPATHLQPVMSRRIDNARSYCTPQCPTPFQPHLHGRGDHLISPHERISNMVDAPSPSSHQSNRLNRTYSEEMSYLDRQLMKPFPQQEATTIISQPVRQQLVNMTNLNVNGDEMTPRSMRHSDSQWKHADYDNGQHVECTLCKDSATLLCSGCSSSAGYSA